MKKKFLLPLLLLMVAALALGMAACSGKDKKSPSVTLTLDRTEISLTEGESADLHADCSDDSLTVEWSSSDTAVATVSEGKVTAVSEGVAQITAEAGGASATCAVTVVADTRPILTVVKINNAEQTEVQLLAGLTAQLDVQLTRGGSPLNARFSYQSSNTGVVTVNESGLITAVARGTAAVSYSATFGGKDYKGSVSVEVNPDILVSLSSSALDLCALEGDGTYGHTATLTATLALDGVVQDASLLTVQSEDPTVASFAGGTVTGLKKGNTRIVATYVDPEDNAEYKAYATVTVHAKKIESSVKAIYSLYDITDSFDVAVEGLEGTVNSVSLDSKEVEFTAGEGKVTVPKTQVQKGGYYTISVTTDTLEFTQQAVIADKVINTAAELANWPYYIRPADWGAKKANKYDGLVVLGNDIDYHGYMHGTVNSTGWYRNELLSNGANYFGGIGTKKTWIGSDNLVDGGMVDDATVPDGATEITSAYSGTFVGTFDGLGHTISGLVMRWSGIGFFGCETSGTVKNVAFTDNLIAYNSFWVSLIAQSFNGTAENLFIECSVPKTCAANNVALVSGRMQPNAKLTNVVCVLSHSGDQDTTTGAAAFGIVAAGTEVSTTAANYTNVIGIGFNKPAVKSGSTVVIPGFNTVSDFLASNPDLSWVEESEYWTKANGFPVIKSAIGKIPGISLRLTSGTSTVKEEDSELKAESGGTVLLIGTGWSVKPWSDVTWDTWWSIASNSQQAGLYSYSATVDGVANDGFTVRMSKVTDGDQQVVAAEITIPGTIQEGSKVTILATSRLTGETASIEFTVEGIIIEHDLEGTALVAKNRPDSQTLGITVDELTADVSSVMSVMLGDTDITDKATIDGKTVNIDMTDVASGTTSTITAMFISGGKTYRVTKAFEVVDWAIGTAAEFSAFGDAVAQKSVYGYNSGENPFSSNKPKYYVTEEQNMGLCILTDNIDYEGEDFNTHAYKRNFYGTFDGRGYTLYNVTGYRGLFFSVAGVDANHPSVVKNLAIVNFRTTVSTGDNAGILAYNLAFVSIDNCYFSGVFTNSGTSTVGIGQFNSSYMAKGSQISNVVINVEYVTGADRPLIVNSPRQNYIENVYAISSMPAKASVSSAGASEDKAGLAGTGHANGRYRNLHTYLSVAAFKEDVTRIPTRETEFANKGSYFNDYWTIDTNSGALVFKSTLNIIDDIYAGEFTITAESSNAPVDFTLDVSTDKYNVLWKVTEGLTHEETVEPEEGAEEAEPTTQTVKDYSVTLGSGVPFVERTAQIGSTFKVRAYYIDVLGELHESNELTFMVEATLETPTSLTADTENKKVIWEEVEGADSYKVTVTYTENDEEKTDESTVTVAEIDLSSYRAGSYNVTVVAVSSDDAVHESHGASVTCIVTEKLSAPTNVQSQNGKITWNSVPNADGYKVIIKNASDEVVAEKSVTTAEYMLVSLAEGTHTLTVVATYSGTPAIYTQSDESEALTFADVQVAFSSESVDVCTLEGDETYNHTATVSATVTVGGEIDSSATVTYISLDESVATVSASGTVTGVKVGTTRIMALYTEGGKDYVGYVAVNVRPKAVAASGQMVLDLYNDKLIIAIPTELGNNVHEVSVDGKKVEFTVSDGKISASKTGITYGYNKSVTIVDDTYAYTQQAVIASKVITTVEELNNWPRFLGGATKGLVVLGADIDFNGAAFVQSTENIVEGITFDGLGHTVANMYYNTMSNGLCGKNLYGTVRNVAIVGVKTFPVAHTYAIAQNIWGTAVVENIFVEGGISNNIGQSGSLVCQTAQPGAQLTNVVAVLSHSSEAAGSIVASAVTNSNFNNVIGIGNKAFVGNATVTGLTGYGTVADYLATTPNLDWVKDCEYWTIENGFPIFKTAIAYITAPTKLTLTSGTSEVAGTDGAYSVAAGGTVNIVVPEGKTAAAATVDTASWQAGQYSYTVEVSGEYDGDPITVSGTTLTIPEGVPSGSTVTVTGTSYLTGEKIVLEFTVA